MFTISPATPLISTRSPMRMPFLPIRTNQPKNATMKSCSATVRPAVASPRMVGNWLGRPKITSRINRAPVKSMASFTMVLRVCLRP